MAETSGFFDAQLNETGEFDRVYFAEQFANYFKQMIGNGVFISPTNQLKVLAFSEMVIKVSAGWAYINGYWYHNDEDLYITVPNNTTAITRNDSVKLRFSNTNREIKVGIFENDTSVIRSGGIYELKLADISVPSFANQIKDMNIVDKRVDESVCGFVKGILEIETTNDLFMQYNSAFEEWFNLVKDQVTGDLAIRLQTEFEQINSDIIQYKDDVAGYQETVVSMINGYNEENRRILNASQGLIEDYVYNDYVIQEMDFEFINRVCYIQDDKVKESSLLDVYFTSETIEEAEDCQIVVDSSNGLITMTANKQPSKMLKGMIRVRVN